MIDGTKRASLLLLALVAGCDRRPSWAKPPGEASGSISGESTIAGPPLPVRRASAAFALDGKLDDAAWSTSAIAGPFVGPGGGESLHANQATASFARLSWDDRGLVVGVVVRDRAPTSPFAQGDVDPRIWERSSAIELMIQPGDLGDGKDYFEIQIDVAGALFDTRWEDYNVPIRTTPEGKRFGHEEWSSKAERAVHVSERGDFYAVEARIPWSAFTAEAPGGATARVAVPPRPGDVWRLNLYAFRDGQRLASAWSPIRGAGNFHRAQRWGRIVFE